MPLEEAHANKPDEAPLCIDLWIRSFQESFISEAKIGGNFYEIHGHPIFDHDGHVIGAAHMAHNISMRVEAANESFLASQLLEQNMEESTKQLEKSHVLLKQETEIR